MKYVKCLNCGENVKIDTSEAIDFEGEIFKCKNCGFKFRYCEK